MTRVLRLLAVLVAGLLLLSACSTGPASTAGGSATASSSTGGAEDGAFPVTIEHAFGKTTIEKEPTRVATVGWSDQDMALSLGVVPVGSTKITYGGNDKGSTDWFDAKLAELGGTQPARWDENDGVPFDAIAKVSPDLILATNSGLTQADYDKLSKIAPVVAFPEKAWTTPWQTSLDLVGRALGRPAAAKKAEEDTLAAIRTAVDEHPAIKGKSFIFASAMSTDTSKLSVYTSVDNRVRVISQLGLTVAPIVEQLNTAKGAFYYDVSAERAPKLASDIAMIYSDTADVATTDKLLSQMPAIKRGASVVVTDEPEAGTLSTPSPLSIPTLLKTYLPQLDAAAQKAG
ncbi:ABC transporter substrate-binding protein [Tersicoccus solisilvae]|uniref:ABC transporter substrate-binding protein n=1 Tax=Tersicoccus solisilvae TaxID=1882339 RepID=A0ABQ1NLX8_9MICC|nr:ABC transporter substrate-binding protein [Tersicoccus solisilvae]GGC80229.1 ABC transporter substrate-binding protein [Tersicoccus solisilvae]